MPKVVIDGVEYVPKGEIPELNDERLQGALEVLAEMIYFNQYHKMKGLAYNALKHLAPEIAKIQDETAIYERINGTED